MSGWPAYQGWIELVFVGAVALGFGVWQLWSVNREIARDKDKQSPGERSPDQRSPEERGSSARPGHAVREHELDQR